MFLVRDGHVLVFFDRNPRFEGFSGNVQEDVSFYEPLDADEWPDGMRRPEKVVGVSKSNPKLYRVFRYAEDCEEAGYRKLDTRTVVQKESWSDYLLEKIQLALMPEHAQEYVAINLETGEYILGRTPSQVSRAFEARWPDKPMCRRRVDGRPALTFRGK